MSDLVGGQIGPEVSYDVKFEGGKLIASLAYDKGVSVNVALDAKVVLEALKVAIPGSIDDAIISAIEKGLGL